MAFPSFGQSVSETRKWIKEQAEQAKKPAKLEKNKKVVKKMSIVGKLLQLKYRINETAKEEHGWSDDMSSHKSWIMTLISDVRKNNLTKLAREDVQVCNKLWKLYNVK